MQPDQKRPISLVRLHIRLDGAAYPRWKVSTRRLPPSAAPDDRPEIVMCSRCFQDSCSRGLRCARS